MAPAASGGQPASTRALLLWTFLALVGVLAWDAGGLDMAMARWTGGSSGFPMRGERWFLIVFHQVPRIASWTLLAALLVAVRWPFGILRQIERRERIQIVVSGLLAVIAVSLVKTSSATSCPWDQSAFGGAAHYVSHWQWGVADGGPGGCFPAGHASAAFAYIAAWFALRRSVPRAARWALVLALGAGLVLGLAQQWRGAHYMSHTLWTAWICWVVAFGVDWLFHRGVAAPSSSPAT